MIHYMFRALYAHHQEVELYCIVLYAASCIITLKTSEWSRITRI